MLAIVEPGNFLYWPLVKPGNVLYRYTKVKYLEFQSVLIPFEIKEIEFFELEHDL